MAPEPLPILSIDRRRLVREEIETAIDLTFTDGSYIVVNLLAWAAQDVLKGIAKSQGVQLLNDQMENFIKPEKISEWYSLLKADYNFAKHADRDPERNLPAFNPEVSLMSLFTAVTDYETVFKAITIPMGLFRSWMIARRADIIASDSPVHSLSWVFKDGAPLYHAKNLYKLWKEDKQSILSSLGTALPPHIEI
jgi:hypothetical protein